MQPPQPPNFLTSRDAASHNHPQLDELCSQPPTLTYFDRVLAKIDRQQTLQINPCNTTTQNLSYSLYKCPEYLAQPAKELQNLHSSKQKWYAPIKL
jgi:hypothetical protein